MEGGKSSKQLLSNALRESFLNADAALRIHIKNQGARGRHIWLHSIVLYDHSHNDSLCQCWRFVRSL